MSKESAERRQKTSEVTRDPAPKIPAPELTAKDRQQHEKERESTESTAEATVEAAVRSDSRRPLLPEPTASGETRQDVIDPVRMLLPTRYGPLLVDLEVSIDDSPLKKGFDAYVAAVLEEAASSEGDVSWKSFLALVASAPDRFGAASQMAQRSNQQIIKTFDRDRDREADAEEVVKLLFRDAGSSEPFRLRGTDAFQLVDRNESTVFKLLDSNADSVLDSSEQAGASRVLELLDGNADRQIEWEEISTNSMRSDQEDWNERRSHRRGSVAMDLEGFVDWNQLAYAVSPQMSAPLGLDELAVTRLDQDKDGSLNTEEAQHLAVAEPDLAARVEISAPNEKPASIEAIDNDRSAGVHRPSSGRPGLLVWADDSLRLIIEVIANDLRPRIGAAPGESPPEKPIWYYQLRGRAAEFPDALFAWFDTDYDFVLSERELANAPSRLEQLGTGGSISPADLPETYLVQLRQGDPRRDAQRFGLTRRTWRRRARPLWAEALDANGDGDISQVEFLGTSSQFDSLDQNGDGFLDLEETTQSLPESGRKSLVREEHGK